LSIHRAKNPKIRGQHIFLSNNYQENGVSFKVKKIDGIVHAFLVLNMNAVQEYDVLLTKVSLLKIKELQEEFIKIDHKCVRS
jgi:hypothetical protein